MTNWLMFSHPEFRLRFQYPDPTPQGYAVESKESNPAPAVTRVHLTSPGSQELYFEVGRYPAVAPEVAYEQFKQSLIQQFGEVEVGLLEGTRVAARPAFGFTFRWTAGTRTVFYVPDDNGLYRILYNPQSPLNGQVLSSLTFIEQG
jgi:hypothetical protein